MALKAFDYQGCVSHLKANSRGAMSCRKSQKSISKALRDGCVVSGREPSEQDLLDAVRSLCHDQLLPYGRIVRKRLAELADTSDESSFAEMEMSQLRFLCGKSSKLHVELEGEADWSVTVAAEPASFVDIYSSKDDYSEEFWSIAAAYFEGLPADVMNCPGGRYECAKSLVALGLPFLAPYSLAQVCHIVQLAMTQRKILGYRNGAIVPYTRSQTRMKEQCAEHNRLCKKAKMPLATWDVLQQCLWSVLPKWAAEGYPLSNVKRMLRADFFVDLSETALGHSSMCDLFKDWRLRDVCRVRLFGNGYYVFPALPEAMSRHQDTKQQVDPPSLVHANCMPAQDQTTIPLTAMAGPPVWGQHSLPSSSMFSTTPFQPGFTAVPLAKQGTAAPWMDADSFTHVMPNRVGSFDICGQTYGQVPCPQVFPGVAARHNREIHVDSAMGRPEYPSSLPAALSMTMRLPCHGLVFPTLCHETEEDSEACSSLKTTWQGDNVSSSGSGDIDGADVVSIHATSPPPSPYVPCSTPSPFVHASGTFSQMLFAAAQLDSDTDQVFPHVDHASTCSESFDCAISMPASPSIVVADTPSPICDRKSFSQLLRAEVKVDDAPSSEFDFRHFGTAAAAADAVVAVAQDFSETAASGPMAARKQLRQAIEKELTLIAELELKVASGNVLNTSELAKLSRKADLLLEVNMLARFS